MGCNHLVGKDYKVRKHVRIMKEIIGSVILDYEETDSGGITILIRTPSGKHAMIYINSNEGGIDDIESTIKLNGPDLIKKYEDIRSKENAINYLNRQTVIYTKDTIRQGENIKLGNYGLVVRSSKKDAIGKAVEDSINLPDGRQTVMVALKLQDPSSFDT